MIQKSYEIPLGGLFDAEYRVYRSQFSYFTGLHNGRHLVIHGDECTCWDTFQDAIQFRYQHYKLNDIVLVHQINLRDTFIEKE